jgi:hypothetical protein
MSALRFAPPQIEPVVGTLCVAEGTRRNTAPCAAMLTLPPWAERSREGDYLFLLLDLSGQAPPRLYREMREVIARAYWSTGGSITAALRQAATAANRQLFQFNLHAASSDRCYGSLACAVLRGEDFFILVAGPSQACVLRRGQFEFFPRDGELPYLGMGRLADVQLYHTFAAVGDTLLLASPGLAKAVDVAGLNRVLPRTDIQEVMAGLEQVGAGADFTALVGRLGLPAEASSSMAAQVEVPAIREPAHPTLRERISERLKRARPEEDLEEEGFPSFLSRERPVEPLRVAGERESPPAPKPEPQPQPKPIRTGPTLSERLKDGARTVGGGIAVAAERLARGTRTLLRRMLPGPDREARRRARPQREPPKENPIVMLSAAVGILLLVIVVVVLALGTLGGAERFRGLVNQADQARREAERAQAIGDDSTARAYWEKVLDLAGKAVEMQPEGSEAIGLQAKAQAALDDLDGVVRLQITEVGHLGSRLDGDAGLRRLIVYGQTAFVLDPKAGWVSKLPIDLAEDGSAEIMSAFVQTGDQISGGTVGDIVDFAWIEPAGEWRTNGLVILEKGGVLVTYDPLWGGESGEPQLKRTFLGTPPSETVKAVDSFEGRFYILDGSQIWRYEPRNDAYPDQPERYFTDPASVLLGDAVDMAIDGSIYVLHADGDISKFLRGEIQSLEVRGVPGGFNQPVALAVDTESRSGVVYVADRGNKRVVVLEPDGAFRAQFHAEGAFDGLEALVVNEAAGRLYIFSGGRLYVALLPAVGP